MIKEIEQYSFSFKELKFSEEILLSAFRDFNEITRPILSEIYQSYYPFIKSNCKPKAGYKKFEKNSFRILNHQLRINHTEFNLGPIISRDISEVSTIFIFVCTIGSEIENEIQKLNAQGKVIESFILDKIASELVELTADRLAEKIQDNLFNEEIFLTNRYSPGYCGWSVEEQKKLFSLLPENFCGITLTDSAMMIPIKSVSGIYGAGYHLVKKDYHCEICEEEFCYRKKIKV